MRKCAIYRAAYRKGIRLIFLNQDVDTVWQISETGDRGREPEKSYLFFLTTFYPGIRLPGDRVPQLGKHLMSEVFGAFRTRLENPVERFIRTPGRTHNRIRSPR